MVPPLPEPIWEHLDEIPPQELPPRVLGPPTIITGTGFFEYFLPLMAIMGDIIDVHHRRQHPRLGGLDDDPAVAVISDLLAECEQSIEKLSQEPEEPPPPPSHQPVPSGGPSIKDLVTNGPPPSSAAVDTAVPATGPPPLSHQQRQKQQQQQQPQQPPASSQTTTTTTTTTTATATATATAAKTQSQRQLVTAYSTHILHVLHVLLHGKWDAISMLDDDDDWITSARFNACASHAVAASQAVSRILLLDPELTFMPYLFGIYLLHGSFILLLFADRMPQLGPNQSVEQACETIIRAHEVCVVTLSTEFQKNFRKVLRSTLYSVRGSSPTEWEEHKARRRALSLYRWTRGARGLAL
ncbi:hypothetical protein VTK73DRAFT_5214 [Phialemonium thermophilum]|uniref:Xylanolytic transcriptional activator xlnR n=1 Tax=Phialemonium thermophilum TaxID=223376 RepID=A0ABR3V485_9PEZI